MKDLVHLGNIKLKKFNYSNLIDDTGKYHFENGEDLFEINIIDLSVGFNSDYYISEVKKLLSFEYMSNLDLLYFKDVQKHTDEHWMKILGMDSYFCHVVLHGSGTLRIHHWKQSIENELIIKRGDVFLLNPRTAHSFEMSKNAKFVRTFCLTIAGINLK